MNKLYKPRTKWQRFKIEAAVTLFAGGICMSFLYIVLFAAKGWTLDYKPFVCFLGSLLGLFGTYLYDTALFLDNNTE